MKRGVTAQGRELHGICAAVAVLVVEEAARVGFIEDSVARIVCLARGAGVERRLGELSRRREHGEHEIVEDNGVIGMHELSDDVDVGGSGLCIEHETVQAFAALESVDALAAMEGIVAALAAQLVGAAITDDGLRYCIAD